MIVNTETNVAAGITCGAMLKVLVTILIFFICIGAGYCAFAESDGGEVKKLAVMNFDNRSPTGQWQWLSKGLADMLITDLSASSGLMIIERERLSEITHELQLTKTRLADSLVADQVGRVAKVDWVLFGSYLKEGEHLKIEAHLLDLKTQELLRVEWVEGKAEDLFKLEKKLAFRIIKNLHIPVTEAEKESIRYVPTDSIEAVEHFYNGLDYYDKGEYGRAYVEFRGALKKDRRYVEAMMWVATIYSSMGRYRHAVTEYEGLLSHYPKHKLADKVLFKLARLYDKKLSLTELAIKNYSKLTNRYNNSAHAVTSQYRLARLREINGSLPIDVYQSYQAVSKYPITAFGEGQHDLASTAFKKSQTYYVELFNQFKGSPPAVEGVVVLCPESATFYRNYASGEGKSCRTGSWGYYGQEKEGYIFRATEGYVFKEFYIEMTRSPSEKKRSGNLSFVADIYLKSISPRYYPSSGRLAIDDIDPISVNKIISIEKKTNLVQVEATDLFSALVSWKLTAKFFPSNKISRLRSIRRERLERYTTGNDSGRMPFLTGQTEGGMYNITFIQDREGIFRLAYNNVTCFEGSFGQSGTDPDIYIMSSVDGKKWSEAVNLPINSMNPDLGPFLIQDRDGIFWLTWLRGGKMWISSSRNCHNWTRPRKVDNGLPGPPERARCISTQTFFQDCSGEYWIIFENADLYAIHSSDCVNWSEPINITKSNISGDKRFPVAFQDRQGIYRVAWGRQSSKARDITMAMSSDGVNWKIKEIEFAADDRKSHMNFSSFMQDKTDRYFLLFYMNGVKYSVSNDCKEWSELRELKRGGFWSPILYQDNRGQFWLIRRTKRNEDDQLLTITNSIE